MIRRELLGGAAKHVARELVEQDHAGERGRADRRGSIDGQLALLRPELEEALLDPVIELRPAAPPLLWVEAEPEFEDLGSPVAPAQAAVPPTVRPSISSVG